MKQWPQIGSKIKFKGTHIFWFVNIVKDANELLEVDKEYTVLKLQLASSWCGVVVEEFPEHKFSLSFFAYEKDLTTEEVKNLERDAWDTVKYEFKTLEELRDKKNEL
jgi:hypothetical protein